MNAQFDAIVIGSGITGGWAAKELTQKGLKVLLLERGPLIEHRSGYTKETTPPWEMTFRGYGDADLFKSDYAIQSNLDEFNEWTQDHFVNDRENPYQTTQENPFQWHRGYQLGGRSLTWGRQCYRWSDLDFRANSLDGHGVDWPIRYADLAPWYDHVERFIGVSGSMEGLDALPDGQFQKPMEMYAVEKRLKTALEAAYPSRKLIIGRTANMTEAKPGRSACQYRGVCERGCSFGAYFSTQSSTLPAARATNNLTLITDSVVESVDYDPATRQAVGVKVIDATTNSRRTYTSRLIFLCAGSVNTISVLLRSQSEIFPTGLGDGSRTLGRYFMDHAMALSAVAKIPNFDDHAYRGVRRNGVYIPRYLNTTEAEPSLLRGYALQGVTYRTGWSRGGSQPGIGAAFKASLRSPGDWHILFGAFAEPLPRADNVVSLDSRNLDAFGMPQTRIDYTYGENERRLLAHAEREVRKMLMLVDADILASSADPGSGGTAIHEMGGARMGHDPKTSVLNGVNRMHEVSNVYVTDGAAMSSAATQNPSLTYMALTARACDAAVSQLRADGA